MLSRASRIRTPSRAARSASEPRAEASGHQSRDREGAEKSEVQSSKMRRTPHRSLNFELRLSNFRRGLARPQASALLTHAMRRFGSSPSGRHPPRHRSNRPLVFGLLDFLIFRRFDLSVAPLSLRLPPAPGRYTMRGDPTWGPRGVPGCHRGSGFPCGLARYNPCSTLHLRSGC